VITGYNAKWNIQKPHIRTIAAGSTLVFTAEEDMTLSRRIFAGAKQNEGFGQVLFCKADNFAETSKKKEISGTETFENGILSELISQNEKIEKMRQSAIKFVQEQSGKIINSAQVGRYLLMTQNAENLDELISWKDNIKTDAPRAFFNTIIEKSNVSEQGDLWREYLTLILTLIKYANRRGEQA